MQSADECTDIIEFLADYLEIPDNVLSESVEQTNTYIVCEILGRYSKKYKKEMKNQQKIEKRQLKFKL